MEEEPFLLSSSTKCWLFLCGLVAFPLVHRLVFLFLPCMFPWLEKGNAFRISTRIISGLQSLAVVTISGRAVLVCNDIMKDEDKFIHAYIWFGISYFPYDIIVMYIGNTYTEIHEKHYISHLKSFMRFFKREKVMVLHHIIFLAVGLPVSEFFKKRIGDYFLCCFFLAEASTPFYSMRGILKEFGIKSGRIYVLNGLLFLVTFFFSRVLSTPLMFLRYSYYADIPFLAVPFSIPRKCTVLSFMFFLLQFYWFRLICLAVLRHVFEKRDSVEITTRNGIGNEKMRNGENSKYGHFKAS